VYNEKKKPARTKADFNMSILQEVIAVRAQLFSVGSDIARTKIRVKPMCEETSVINSVARTFFLLRLFV